MLGYFSPNRLKGGDINEPCPIPVTWIYYKQRRHYGEFQLNL
uniref:Uncharacterized protein n=1 Tax=Tetranychus urticae TaxID=32264 RepID=T1K9N4_TETUR